MVDEHAELCAASLKASQETLLANTSVRALLVSIGECRHQLLTSLMTIALERYPQL